MTKILLCYTETNKFIVVFPTRISLCSIFRTSFRRTKYSKRSTNALWFYVCTFIACWSPIRPLMWPSSGCSDSDTFQLYTYSYSHLPEDCGNHYTIKLHTQNRSALTYFTHQTVACFCIDVCLTQIRYWLSYLHLKAEKPSLTADQTPVLGIWYGKKGQAIQRHKHHRSQVNL